MNENSDVMYRLLVQSVVDYAIYMLDPDGRIINWNPGAERAKGYSSDEIIGKHVSLFYSLEDQLNKIPEDNLRRAAQEGSVSAEGWRYRKDGSAFWAHISLAAVYDNHRQLLGFAKVTHDITERRDYTQQIVHARDLAEVQGAHMASLSGFLDTIIANIPSCVLVEDAASREILLINAKMEQLFGLSRSHIQGKKVFECMPPELSEHFQLMVNLALHSEGMHTRERKITTAGGMLVLYTRATMVRGGDDETNYVILISDDITEQRQANEQIRHMAHYDSLTGLPNRAFFREQMSEALQQRKEGQQIAILCLDLDNFKNTNDALGHQIGDELLRVVSVRLRTVLDEPMVLARVGGDEFAIILPVITQADEASGIASQLISVTCQPVCLEGHTLSVGVCVGIALSGDDQETPDQLLRCADMALYEAKRKGFNHMEYFTHAMDAHVRNRLQIENDLRQAISRRQLQLYYQPIIHGEQQKIIGYEALMRWYHPDKGLIMPGTFIPVAEDSNLIFSLGAWALHEACREAQRWGSDQTVAVNLSPMQFKNSSLLKTVTAALQSSGLDPCRLEVEITESVLMDESLLTIRMLNELKSLGVLIALDDFGTGYSSLSYLRSFPFDKIKIDRSFINDMAHSREALAIIRAITSISRSLGIQTTAEGVETVEQFEQLREEGCPLYQGYLFGRPQPAENRLQTLSLPPKVIC